MSQLGGGGGASGAAVGIWMLLHVPQCAGQPFTAVNYMDLNINSAEAEKPGLDERGWQTFCKGTADALGSWATFGLSQLLNTQLL